jgi:hypothetical protein
MNALTAIKVPVGTRDRLRDAANAAGVTQAALIDAMLAAREDAEFWAAMAAAPKPADAELDQVDADFVATAGDGE